MILAEFMLARIAEREAAARRCVGDDQAAWWHCTGTGVADDDGTDVVEPGQVGPTEWEAQHIALHDPAYVLADCQAKRKIVQACVQDINVLLLKGDDADGEDIGRSEAAWGTLRLLAQVDAEHPDFDPEWQAPA